MGWYSEGHLSPQAFDPRRDETTGISIYRNKYKSVAEVAQGMSKKGYFVAEFRAGDLRKHGIQITPRPEPSDPGHAELPGLTSLNRLEPEALEQKLWLTHLARAVHGPFLSQ